MSYDPNNTPPANQPRGMPPERGRGRERQSDYYRPPTDDDSPLNARRARPSPRRQDSGLYLPLWSVLVMLVIVIAAAVGVVVLIVTVGGRQADGGDPVVVIVTSAASPTPPPDANTPPPTATIPAVQGATVIGALPTFALEGPTLPPVVLSPTPIQIEVGATVVVDASDGLNIRDGAGLQTTILFRADDQTRFTIIGGPTSVDNLTWWQVVSPIDPTQTGWAAADYLRVLPPS
jgi:hypothetical protein